MSEHTPLTEAEINALGPFIWGGWLGVDAEKHADYAHELLELVGRIKSDAARTSTATADTGLRERVEAALDYDRRDEPGPNGEPPEPGSWRRGARHVAVRVRAALDATAAPTTAFWIVVLGLVADHGS